MHDHIQPAGLSPSERFGFTQVVASRGGKTVYISGQTAADAAGAPVGGDDIGAQAAAALANVGHALSAAGAVPADVAMIRVYIVNYSMDMVPAIGGEVAKFFGGAKPPASTWIGVQALFHPAFQIEIEAIAVA